MPEQTPFDEAEFLRRTFDRSLEETERSRAYFEKLLKSATWYIGTLTTISFLAIGFLGFRNYSDVENRMNATMQRVSSDIQEKGQKTIQETDKEIRDNAKQAFEQENLRTYIRDVAKSKTEQVLSGQINDVVKQQVSSRIASEQPEIRKTVISETKKAVESLSPTISTNISSEVQKQSNEALNPLRQDVNVFREFLKVSTLAIEARNGDGKAYDEVEHLANTSQDPEIRQICVSTINQIFVEMNSGIYTARTFTQPKTTDQLNQLMHDPNPILRWAAVDALSAKGGKGLVPELISIINIDESLWVRTAAYQALQQLTGQRFDKFDKNSWNAWWESTKSNWPPK